MALQFGQTKIGAMQYNGVTIGEAMIDGQTVYTSGYEASGTLPVVGLNRAEAKVLYSHTIPTGMTVLVNASITWRAVNTAAAYRFSILKNGQREVTSNAPSTGSPLLHALYASIECQAGDVIGFEAVAASQQANFREYLSGSWSITKN